MVTMAASACAVRSGLPAGMGRRTPAWGRQPRGIRL